MNRYLSALLLIHQAAEVSSFIRPSPELKSPIQRVTTGTSSIHQRLFMSDIPQQENKGNEKTMTTADKREKLFDDLVGYLPPPPEDQFTMTGDIGVLFLYSFMGHALDDYVVKSVFDSSDSARQAIETLDPLQEVVHIQTPVWLDSTPQLTDQIISLNAQETLMKTWGPLFSSAGVSSIALCSCWLLAGYLHRSFSYENSIDCDAASALQKTLVTWVTMIGILALLTLGSNALVGQTPLLQAWVGCHCLDFLFTKDDMLFLVDSGTVLFAWRYMANIIAQYLR